jgi:hypothetical protein
MCAMLMLPDCPLDMRTQAAKLLEDSLLGPEGRWEIVERNPLKDARL